MKPQSKEKYYSKYKGIFEIVKYLSVLGIRKHRIYLEAEFHVLLFCPLYEELRTGYLPQTCHGKIE